MDVLVSCIIVVSSISTALLVLVLAWVGIFAPITNTTGADAAVEVLVDDFSKPRRRSYHKGRHGQKGGERKSLYTKEIIHCLFILLCQI